MNANISPEMLSMLDGEMKDIASKKRDFRKVKIEENDSWLVRYLPFEFGTRNPKPFWMKVANHWIMKRPYFCPRNSSPEVGGHPDAHCPICDRVEEMCDSPDQSLRKAGFRASATQQWLMYCWVFERELVKNRGDKEVSTGDERWIPWEYWHSKWGFEEFTGIFRQCANRRHNPINVLDFMNGCNFWAASTQKGISLRREDSGPLYDENGNGYSEEELQQIIDFAWSKIKPPTYTALNDEQIDAAMTKLEESTRGESRPAASASSRRNFREGSSDDDGDLAPQTRRTPSPSVTKASSPRISAPSARPAAQPQAQAPRDEAQESDPGQDFEPQKPPASAPRVSPPSVAVARGPGLSSRASSQPPPASSGAPKPSISERLRVRTPASREQVPVQAPRGSGESTVDNDADNVTDESRDPAPPADVPIDEAPPQVSAQGESAVADQPKMSSAPRISSKLRTGIAAATNRK